MSVLVAVTDHAVERFGQRVRGSLDARAEIIRRVASAWMAQAGSTWAVSGWATQPWRS